MKPGMRKAEPRVIDLRDDDLILPSPPAQVPSVRRIDANITVGGDISGQVAIGENIVQMRIDTMHGDVVQIVPGAHHPTVARRPPPLRLRPRKVDVFLDRTDEVGAATEAIAAGDGIEFHGPPGVGKSTLLRHLSYHPAASSVAGGLAHLAVRGMSVDDLLQASFELVYETSAPLKPGRGALRGYLQDVDSLLLLDDAELDSEQLDEFLDFMPACPVVLTSQTSALQHRSILLEGLPEEDAMALLARGLRRPLHADEVLAARELHAAVGGRPVDLIRAAVLVRDGSRSLSEVSTRAGSLAVDAAATATDSERRVLGLLAVAPGLALDADQVVAATGDPRSARALDSAADRGLGQLVSVVPWHPPGYGLDAEIRGAIAAHWDLTTAVDELRRYFADWSAGQLHMLDAPLPHIEAARTWAEWLAAEGRWTDLLQVARALDASLALSGRWDAWQRTLELLLDAAVTAGDDAAAAFAAHQLGTRALCVGDPLGAQEHLQAALRQRERLGDAEGAATTRHNIRVLHRLFPPGGSLVHRLRRAVAPVAAVAAAVIVVVILAGFAVGQFRGQPELGVDPAAVDFGEQQVAARGGVRTVTVDNPGPDPVTGVETGVDGAHATDFVIDEDTCAGGLAAGQSCTVGVRFAPTQEESRTATLAITADGQELTVGLAGVGVAAPPTVVAVDPTAVDFGEQQVATRSNPRTVTVSNQGVVAATIDVQGRGSHATDFILARDGCSGVELDPAASCAVEVLFMPSDRGARAADLVVLAGDATPASVPLRGNGVAVVEIIPDVVGVELEDAREVLADHGFVVGTVLRSSSDEFEAGIVATQRPQAGSTQAVGSAVDLTVSTGPGPRVEVPNVVGLTQSVAEARLRGLRLEVEAVRHHDDDVESEQVVRQAPGPPTLVEPGTVVVINVAVPVPQVTVPPLQGLALDRATQSLKDARLTSGEVTHEPHDSAPEGVVIRQSPQSGTTVPPGDPVHLTVSSGPTLIGVPDVRSMQADEAVERLRGAGLTPAVKGLVGDFRLEDHFVSRQDPGPDARVPPGEEVLLTLDVLL